MDEEEKKKSEHFVLVLVKVYILVRKVFIIFQPANVFRPKNRKIGIVKIDVPDLLNGEISKISLRIMFLNE
jgi:hypothetical protein